MLFIMQRKTKIILGSKFGIIINNPKQDCKLIET